MKRALDLFAGAGGASIGLTAANYDVIAYDSWDDAIETHRLNGMWIAKLDLSTLSAEQWKEAWGGEGEIDLMWASPPCQGWSQGGKHKGKDDPRNGFPWTLKAIEGVMPRVVLCENVRGLSFKRNAPYLEQFVMEPLRALGYRAEWRLLNCADYGVPQRRVRLFIVARLDGDPVWPTPTHAEPPHHEYTGREPWVTMATALGWGRTDAPSCTVVGGSSRTGSAAPLDGGAAARKEVTTAREDGRWIEHPEATRAGPSVEVPIEDTAALQGFPPPPYWVGFPRAADRPGDENVVEIDGVEYRRRDLASSDEPAHTLTEKARSWKVYPQYSTGGDWKKGGKREDAQAKDPELEVAPTVRGVPSQSQWRHDDGSHEVVSPEELAVFQSFPLEAPLPEWAHVEPAPTVSTTFGGVPGRKPSGGHRNLTLAEAKILQAFPGGFRFVGTKTSQYLQVGNACPPPLAYLLATVNKPAKPSQA